MNFLAHIYLSGTSKEILVGNFIGDYVKGNKYNNYPEKIKEGILLHRHIDHFTDKNEIVRKSKSHFHNIYGKYSGIIIDILYDHFLAKNWINYCDIALDKFISNLFTVLNDFANVFPQSVKNFFPSFVRNNWLKSYLKLEGIENVLEGMSRRTSLPQHTLSAMTMFRARYYEIETEFNAYFPEIIEFVEASHNIDLHEHKLNKYIPAANPSIVL